MQVWSEGQGRQKAFNGGVVVAPKRLIRIVNLNKMNNKLSLPSAAYLPDACTWGWKRAGHLSAGPPTAPLHSKVTKLSDFFICSLTNFYVVRTLSFPSVLVEFFHVDCNWQLIGFLSPQLEASIAIVAATNCIGMVIFRSDKGGWLRRRFTCLIRFMTHNLCRFMSFLGACSLPVFGGGLFLV